MAETSDAVQLSIREDVVSRTVNGEEVIVDLVSGTYYGLNEIGAEFWRGLRDNESLEQIKKRILEKYEADSETINKDLKTLISDLEEKQLVTLHS